MTVQGACDCIRGNQDMDSSQCQEIIDTVSDIEGFLIADSSATTVIGLGFAGLAIVATLI